MTIEAGFEVLPFQQAVITSAKCKMFSMPKVMGKAFTEMKEYLDKQGVMYFPAPFTMYKNVDFEKLVKQNMFTMIMCAFTTKYDFDMGYAIMADIEVPEGMELASYNYKNVASCVHTGPYQKVSSTYKELYYWIKEQGKTPMDVSFEMYMNDPQEVKPAELQTKLYIPFKD